MDRTREAVHLGFHLFLFAKHSTDRQNRRNNVYENIVCQYICAKMKTKHQTYFHEASPLDKLRYFVYNNSATGNRAEGYDSTDLKLHYYYAR